MKFLIGVIILITFLLFVYFYFRYKFRKIAKHYLGTTDIKKVLEKAELENENTPKSLGSMDSIYLDNLKHDFKDININELKRLAESVILEIFNCIQTKDLSKLSTKNEKIIAYVKNKLNDFQDTDISNMKIHQTVLNKYEKEKGIATIYLATSFEYFKKENGIKKKVQKRIKTEYIYVIDSNQVKGSLKALGLNCPNCGAPIKSLAKKVCSYCQTGIVDLVKKSFVLNDIYEY